MRILDIHIDGFGNLKNAEYVFSTGMNVKDIGSVWDASTVVEFILAMLFGLEGQAKIRKLYAPRDGVAFGGSMDIFAEGAQYHIFRSFSATDQAADTLEFINTTTNTPVSFAPSYLVGVTRDQYVRNATVIEGSTYDDHSMQDRNLLKSIVNAEEDRFVSNKALESLQRSEARLTRGGTRVVEEARYKEEQKQYELQMDLKYCLQKSDEVKLLREQESEALKTLDEKKALMDEAEQKLLKAQQVISRKTQHILSLILAIICLVGGLLLVLAGVLLRFEIPGAVNGSYDTIYDGFLMVLFALVVLYFRRQWRKRRESKFNVLRAEADGCRQEYEAALAVDTDIQEHIKEASKDAERVGRASDELADFKKRVTSERYQLTVLRGARKYIREATEEAGNEYMRIRDVFQKEAPSLLIMDVFADHALAGEVFGRTAEKCQVIMLR